MSALRVVCLNIAKMNAAETTIKIEGLNNSSTKEEFGDWEIVIRNKNTRELPEEKRGFDTLSITQSEDGEFKVTGN